MLDFPRDIQPILDRHCVECHNPDRREGAADLSGDHTPLFSVSYVTMNRLGLVADGRNEKFGNRPPRTIGSSASRLMSFLDGSHYKATLSVREQKIVRLWIESSAVYAGTYAALGSGMETVAFPVQSIERRCSGCHATEAPKTGRIGQEKLYYRFGSRGPYLPLVHQFTDLQKIRGSIGYYKHGDALPPQALANLTRPEKSLLIRAPLAVQQGGLGICRPTVFTDTNDGDYRAILAAIAEAAARHRAAGRYDMPGFRPNVYYLRMMQHYGVLPPNPDPARCFRRVCPRRSLLAIVLVSYPIGGRGPCAALVSRVADAVVRNRSQANREPAHSSAHCLLFYAEARRPNHVPVPTGPQRRMSLEPKRAGLVEPPVLGQRAFPAVPLAELAAERAHVEGRPSGPDRLQSQRVEGNGPFAAPALRVSPDGPLTSLAAKRTSLPSRCAASRARRRRRRFGPCRPRSRGPRRWPACRPASVPAMQISTPSSLPHVAPC